MRKRFAGMKYIIYRETNEYALEISRVDNQN